MVLRPSEKFSDGRETKSVFLKQFHCRQDDCASQCTGGYSDHQIGDMFHYAAVPMLRVEEIVQKTKVVGDQSAANQEHRQRADNAQAAHKPRHK